MPFSEKDGTDSTLTTGVTPIGTATTHTGVKRAIGVALGDMVMAEVAGVKYLHFVNLLIIIN